MRPASAALDASWTRPRRDALYACDTLAHLRKLHLPLRSTTIESRRLEPPVTRLSEFVLRLEGSGRS